MSELLLKQRNDHLFFQLRLPLPGSPSTFSLPLNLPICGAFLSPHHGAVPFLPPGLQISSRCGLSYHHYISEWLKERFNIEEPIANGRHGKTRRGH